MRYRSASGRGLRALAVLALLGPAACTYGERRLGYEAPPTIAVVEPAGGLPGTHVTIDGAGFMSGARVFLGEVSCDGVERQSSTRLLCITPAQGPGPVSVRVVNANGLEAVAEGGFVYAGALTIEPAAIELAVNNQVSFAGVAGLSPYAYQVLSGGGSVDGEGLYTAPGGAGTAVVRVTDALGQSADAAVTIRPPLRITPPGFVLPVGMSVTFAGADGVPPYAFQLVSGGGAVSAGGGYTAPDSAGTATVRVTDARGNGADAVVTVVLGLAMNPKGTSLAVGNFVDLEVLGGVAPIDFVLTSGPGLLEPVPDVAPDGRRMRYTATAPGDAVIVATDEAGLTTESDVHIAEALGVEPSSVELAVDYQQTFAASGGVPPYALVITSGAGNLDGLSFTATAAGQVSLTLSDALQNTVPIAVTVNPALSLGPDVADLLVGDVLQLVSTGGVGAHAYSLVSGPGSVDADGTYTATAAGAVTVSVQDEFGVTRELSFTVYEPLGLSPLEAYCGVGETIDFVAVGGLPGAVLSSTTAHGSTVVGAGMLAYTCESPGSDTVSADDGRTQASTTVTVIDRGVLDPSFDDDGWDMSNAGTGAHELERVRVDGEGRLVVAGTTTVVGDPSGTRRAVYVARFLDDGTPDPEFSGDGVLITAFSAGAPDTPPVTQNAFGLGLALDGAGRIIVAGYLTPGADGNDLLLLRYLDDGTLDPDFGGGDGVVTTNLQQQESLYAVAVHGDSILVAGTGQATSGGNLRFLAARYTGAGVLDATFNATGNVPGVRLTLIPPSGINTATESVAYDLVVLADGRPVLTGHSAVPLRSTNVALARFTTAGDLDPSFGPVGDDAIAGQVWVELGLGGDKARELAVDASGRYVVAGVNATLPASFLVARFTAAGALDTGFDGDGFAEHNIGLTQVGGASALALQPDGRILVGGNSTPLLDEDLAVVRFGTAGAVESVFGSGGVTVDLGFDERCYGMALDLRGRIVCVGTSLGAGSGGGDEMVIMRLFP